MTSTQYKAIANSSPLARLRHAERLTLAARLDLIAFAAFAVYMVTIILTFGA